MDTYGYKKQDVSSMPTLTVPVDPLYLQMPFSEGTRLVLRYSLMTNAEKKGLEPLANIIGYRQGENPYNWTQGNTGLLGVMKPW
jgi:hypothetical protein